VSKIGYSTATDSFTLNFSAQNPTIFRKDYTLTQGSDVFGAWKFQAWDSTTFNEVHLFNFSMYWGGVKVIDIQNDVLLLKKYPNLFNVSFNTSGTNPNVYQNYVDVLAIPLNTNISWQASHDGYVSSSGAAEVSGSRILTVKYPDQIYRNDIYFHPTGSTPSTDQLTKLVADFSPSAYFVPQNDGRLIQAMYTYNGVLINGATCSVTSSAFVPNSRSLDISGDSSAYQGLVSVGFSLGDQSFMVQCGASGYPTLRYNKSFYVSNDPYTMINVISAPSSSVDMGSKQVFSIDFVGSGDIPISGAACNLLLNGVNRSMSPLAGHSGRYTYSYTVSVAGHYNYNFSCSKTGYMDSSQVYVADFWAYDSNNTNPTTPVTTPAGHCIDGSHNYDETDKDCGGNTCLPCETGKRCGKNSDCKTNYCASGICATSNCNDNIKNGDETGVDCGGSCIACNCGSNWNCASDGSERCVNMVCVLDSCITSADCPSIYFKTSAGGEGDYSRECYNKKCRLQTQNTSSGNVALVIIPLTYYVWNDSGRKVYVSNCEEATNGFTVSTTAKTAKAYKFTDPSYVPAIPTSTANTVFAPDYELSNSVVIPEMCQIPYGDRVYSLIVFMATDGSKVQSQSVYTLTFEKAFNVLMTDSGSGYELNVTRPANCYYRNSSASAWVLIGSSTPAASIMFTGSRSSITQFRCNDSYGESKEFSSGGVSRGIWMFAYDVAAAVSAELFYTVFGVTFAWQDYFLPVALGFFFIVCPISALFILRIIRPRMNNKNGGDGGD
jgi:hypothetical protein